MIRVPYPIPDIACAELVEAGKIAESVGRRTNRTGPEYRSAHARVEQAIADIYNRFGYEEDE